VLEPERDFNSICQYLRMLDIGIDKCMEMGGGAGTGRNERVTQRKEVVSLFLRKRWRKHTKKKDAYIGWEREREGYIKWRQKKMKI
jgi:hypothetical protein